jgi:hypothetical protein
VRDIWLVFDFLIVAISLAFTYVEKVKFGDVKAGITQHCADVG